MAALLPAVNFLISKKFPRLFGVLIPYTFVLALLLLLVLPIFPFFIDQIESLFINMPLYIKDSLALFDIQMDPKEIQNYINPDFAVIGKNAVAVSSAVFGGLLSTLTVLIVSFYLLMSHDNFQRSFSRLFHRDQREAVITTMNQVDMKLGAWLRGQFILCLAIGLITYLVLSLIGLPYALPLALIAGLLEALPTIGPIISAVPALIVAFTYNPTLALFVALIYFAIQMLENNILVPKIMERAVGLNPIVVIVGILIGGSLMGVPGALLSIPFISFSTVLFNNIDKEFD